METSQATSFGLSLPNLSTMSGVTGGRGDQAGDPPGGGKYWKRDEGVDGHPPVGVRDVRVEAVGHGPVEEVVKPGN